jgi:hypothetical protein
MRRNSTVDPRKAKQVARDRYAQRKVDRWIKWSMDNRGYVFYSELVDKQNEFKIYCYG